LELVFEAVDDSFEAALYTAINSDIEAAL